MRSVLDKVFRSLNHLLQAPQKVIWICLGLVLLNLVFDGSLVRLWSLHRDFKNLQDEAVSVSKQNDKLRVQLEKAKDPAFLEREARDRFDLVSEGDLVFVFSEEETP